MTDLSMQSLEDAIIQIRDSIDENRINAKPNQLWVYPQYRREALRMLGWLKHPAVRSSSLRKRKRNMYWRKTA